MRFLLLARPEDRLALEVQLALERRHGRAAVRLATDDELLYGARWSHRLANDRVDTVLELADGARIDSCSELAVFNRLASVPDDAFEGTPEPDRGYARMETHALWLSWLASLAERALDPASPRGLAGPGLGELEWLARARRAGLPARRSLFATSSRILARADAHGLEPAALGANGLPLARGLPLPLGAPACFLEPLEERALATALVVGERVVGALPRAWDDGLRAFARGLGRALLEVRAAPLRGADPRRSESWRVCGADGFPRAVEPARVDAIADELERRARAELRA